jgi:hypothetical protein
LICGIQWFVKILGIVFGKTCFSSLYKVFSQQKFPTFTKAGMRNYQIISFHVKMVIFIFLVKLRNWSFSLWSANLHY